MGARQPNTMVNNQSTEIRERPGKGLMHRNPSSGDPSLKPAGRDSGMTWYYESLWVSYESWSFQNRICARVSGIGM